VLVNQPLPAFATARDLPTVATSMARPSPLAEPTAQPIPTPDSTIADALSVATYLTRTQDIRRALQQATATYKTASAQSATRVERVTAVNTLKTVVEQQQHRLATLVPPARLKPSHTSYLQGLDLERRALEDMLTFYGSNDFTAANRAAVYLQDARLQIETGKAGWETARSTSAATPALPSSGQSDRPSPVPDDQ
jgi:hypothetical protein